MLNTFFTFSTLNINWKSQYSCGISSCHLKGKQRQGVFVFVWKESGLDVSARDIFSWWHSENRWRRQKGLVKERLVHAVHQLVWLSSRKPGVSPEDPQRGEALLLQPVPPHLRPEGRAAPPHALSLGQRRRLPVQLLRQVTEGPAQPQVPREASHRRASPPLLRLRQRSGREGDKLILHSVDWGYKKKKDLSVFSHFLFTQILTFLWVLTALEVHKQTNTNVQLVCF